MSLHTRKGDQGIFDELFAWIERLRATDQYPYGLYEIVFAVEAVIQDIDDANISAIVLRRLRFWLSIVEQSEGASEDASEDAVEAFQDSAAALLAELADWDPSSPDEMQAALDRLLPRPPSGWVPEEVFARGLRQRFLSQMKTGFSFRVKDKGSDSAKVINEIGKFIEEGELRVSALRSFKVFFKDIQKVFVSRAPAGATNTRIEEIPPAMFDVSRRVAAIEAVYLWTVKLTFPDEATAAASVSHCLWAFSTALETIDGVSVTIDEWGKGSLWVKLKLYIRNIWARDEVREVLQQGKDAVRSHYLDRPVEETMKVRAEREKLEEERRQLEDDRVDKPSPAQREEVRRLDLEERRQQVRSMDLENRKKELELLRMASDLIRDGVVAANEVSIDVNGMFYLLVSGNRLETVEDLKSIESAGQTIRNDDPPPEESVGTGETD